jgi:hypothetical protein
VTIAWKTAEGTRTENAVAAGVAREPLPEADARAPEETEGEAEKEKPARTDVIADGQHEAAAHTGAQVQGGLPTEEQQPAAVASGHGPVPGALAKAGKEEEDHSRGPDPDAPCPDPGHRLQDPRGGLNEETGTNQQAQQRLEAMETCSVNLQGASQPWPTSRTRDCRRTRSKN